MTTPRDHSFPIIDGILHPTDFSEGSLVAFHHALKAALIAQAPLALMYVKSGSPDERMDFPGVRETLERWGLLPQDSPPSAVAELGIEVRKVVASEAEPVRAVLGYLEDHASDLIVLAAHRHEGRMAWLRNSVAQPLARKSGQTTLFIPDGVAGFVSATDGSVSLKTILIPITGTPDPQPALEAAARLVHRMNCTEGNFILLHIGEPETLPEVECPEVPGWNWQTISCTGDVIHNILDTAHKWKADLVVMVTKGHRGFLDALRGSHSERVLQEVPVPLLAVPSGSRVAQTLEMGTHS